MSGSEEHGGESNLTVIIAFCANLAIAVAKSVAAALTGSASLVAEAAHSWADAGNQVLLMIAERRSNRPPDRSRPWGYGREAYVWSIFAALGLFVAGGAASIYHGVVAWSEKSADTDFTVGYIVLAVAFVFEGFSLSQAFRQVRREAGSLGRDILDHALATSDPTLRAVLAEDSAALAGLVIAAAGMWLHQQTGNPVYDAAGSIVVGLLLCAVALVLIDRNRRFLTGQVADTAIHDAVLSRLYELPSIDRVTMLRLEFLGPRELLLVAHVDLRGDEAESVLAERLQRLEVEIERNPRIMDAVLTLATAEEETLTPASDPDTPAGSALKAGGRSET